MPVGHLADLVTVTQLQFQLERLSNSLKELIYAQNSIQGSLPASGGFTNSLALTNRIDQLSGTNISHATISNSSIDTASLPDISGSYLSIVNGTSTARSSLGLSYANTADAANSHYTIATWGDSLTAYGYPNYLSTYIGNRSVYNKGVGGETTAQIANRMVAATFSRSWTHVIWAAFNNFTNLYTGSNRVVDTKADIDRMVVSLGANAHYVILSIPTGANERRGTANYDDIIAVNNYLAATYPKNYYDIRAYLVSQYTPNIPQDVTDYSDDIIPSSLRADQIHLNVRGDQLVAQKVSEFITTKLDTLANLNQVLTPASLPYIFANPMSFGGFVDTSATQGGFSIGKTPVLLASSTTFTTLVGLGAGAAFTPLAVSNTAIGFQALYYATSSTGNTAVGRQALQNDTSGSSNVGVGFSALLNNTTGSNSAAVGNNALINNLTGGQNIAFGTNALFSNTSGSDNVAVGHQSLNANTDGSGNVAIGRQALYNATSSSFNTAVGFSSLLQNTTGNKNTALGYNAANQNKTGAQNTSVGYGALNTNQSGSDNVAIGYNAGQRNQPASSTVVIGSEAGFGSVNPYTSGGGVWVGYRAGFNAQSNSDFNIMLGYRAGYNVSSGSNNIWIGTATSSTGTANLTTGSQNILIGNNISLPSATASGQLNIANTIYGTGITSTGPMVSTGSIGIGTTTPWRKFAVTGTVGFDGLTGSTGAGSLCLSANKEVVYNSGSDACLSSLRATKHGITVLTLQGTTTIAALQSVSFVYNDDASSTVRYGFVAEDAAAVNIHFATHDANGNISGIDDRSIISVLVKAVQELTATVADFAVSIVSAHVSATVADFDTVNIKKLCAVKADGSEVCVTGDQLAIILSSSGGSPGLSSSSTSLNPSTSTPDTAPPFLTVLGDNPTYVHIGDRYADLGARITGPPTDLNLGIKTFLNGIIANRIEIDTSTATTDTIEYVAADQSGLTSTSSRTVIVEGAGSAHWALPIPANYLF
jgi:hypothetical protein